MVSLCLGGKKIVESEKRRLCPFLPDSFFCCYPSARSWAYPQALFYASNGCGGKCGTGSYVVMQRIGSNWRVLKEIVFWMS